MPRVDPSTTPADAMANPVSEGMNIPEDMPASSGDSSVAVNSQPVTAPAITVPGREPAAAGSKNTGLHNFVNTILGALAGAPPMTYTTTAEGKLIAQAAPLTAAQKLKRLANTVGEGLSAGSQVGPRGSGLANALAGFGAGFDAQGKKLSDADKAAQGKARKDFETEQQTMLHKMELAKGNALLYSTYKHLHDADLDKNEEYKVNSDIANAFEAEKFPVRRVNGDQLMKEFNESPQQLLTEGRVLLTGERAMTTSDGQAIVDAQTQQPRYERTYAIVDGMHEGKIKAPQSFIDYVQKYAPYKSGRPIPELDSLASHVGEDLDHKTFYALHNAALEGMKAVTEGWAKPEAVETKDKDGQIQVLERNPISGETRPATDEQKNAYQMNKARLAAEQSIAPKNKAEQDKAEADAQKAKKDAAAGPASNLTGADYLQTLPTARRGIVQAVGEGRQTLPANRKEALALLDDVHQAYPDYDESKGKTWGKTRNEYMGSGKTATVVVPAYNTALEHMQDLYTNTTRDGVFNPLSKAYQDREVALGYVAREVGKAVSSGALTQKESEDLLNTLKGGLTPALKRERITKTAQLLHDKIDEYQTKFNEGAPSSAVKVPILISPRAAASYDFVQSGGQAQNQTSPPNTQPSGQGQMPPGATHIVPGPDGKMHYTNAAGTKDFGVAQ
jgi:hypothetical protein